MNTYTAPGDGFSLTALAVPMGRDLCVLLTGGAAHIGSLSAATPRPSLADPAVLSATASTFCYPGHKDGKIGEWFAEQLSARLGKKAAVLCGIHYDGLKPEGIAAITALARALLEQVVQGEAGAAH